MTSSAVFSHSIGPRRSAYILGAVAAGMMITGIFAQDPIAYLCVAVPAMVPLYLWMRAGALGMPVLPVISGLFFVYYAIPLLRSQTLAYGSEQLIAAGATVGSFLLAASIASWPFLGRGRRQSRSYGRNFVSDTQIVRLVFVGLAAGILYHLALVSGYLNWLGASVALVRAVVLTFTSVACYLLGCARASRSLVGGRWAFALGGMFALVVLALSNLLLIGGLMNVLAAFLGYVITAKRIPWIGVAAAGALLAVLHAGKFEMRTAYWMPSSQSLQQSSVFQMPGMMADWVTAGVGALWSGRTETDVLERASLLHMLLLVQRATPDYIPYLEGETYALLPSMLVPRIFDPEKPQSQAGLNLLSVHYGLQKVESTASTTIGWGLVAEAYANFGQLAVLPVGALFGALCGALMRMSAGAPPLSLSMLVTIAAALVLFNLELDLSYLITTLAQSVAAALLFAGLPKFLARRRRMAIDPRAAALRPSRYPAGDTS